MHQGIYIYKNKISFIRTNTSHAVIHASPHFIQAGNHLPQYYYPFYSSYIATYDHSTFKIPEINKMSLNLHESEDIKA